MVEKKGCSFYGNISFISYCIILSRSLALYIYIYTYIYVYRETFCRENQVIIREYVNFSSRIRGNITCTLRFSIFNLFKLAVLQQRWLKKFTFSGYNYFFLNTILLVGITSTYLDDKSKRHFSTSCGLYTRVLFLWVCYFSFFRGIH